MLENQNPRLPLEARLTATLPGIGATVSPNGRTHSLPATASRVQNRLHEPVLNANGQIDGVKTLDLIQSSNGRNGYVFLIDGREYRMNSALGKTLVALAADDGDFPDRFRGWKSKSSLLETLAVSNGAFASRVRRLRRYFDEKSDHISRETIMADRKRGFRFAVEHSFGR